MTELQSPALGAPPTDADGHLGAPASPRGVPGHVGRTHEHWLRPRRRRGPARFVVGVRPMPFLAHAWVEVAGTVVNDWPRVRQFYPPLGAY